MAHPWKNRHGIHSITTQEYAEMLLALEQRQATLIERKISLPPSYQDANDKQLVDVETLINILHTALKNGNMRLVWGD